MKLAYREYGTGTPLIIMHGLFGQSDNWNSLAKTFSEHGLNVFTVDLRNHGLTGHSEDWNYPVMAADMKEFIEEHRLNGAVLLGHSMGGKVAMFHEFAYPGLVSGLIIADIAARYYPPHHQEVIKALNAVDFSLVRNRKEAEAILSEYLSDYGTKQFLLKNLYWKENGVLDWRFDLAVISRNIESVGTEVPPFNSNTPALILKGERSNYITKEDLADFCKRFKHLKSEEIKGAGHWLHAEKPNEFFKAVMDFIKA